MIDKEIKEYVKKLIDFSADPTVISRGRRLFKDNAVTLKEYDEKNDTWKFTVLGTKLYDVYIKNLNQKNVTTSCTCPYDWGIMCKHVVGALNYITESNDKNKNTSRPIIEKSTSKRIMPGKKFPIPLNEPITMDFIHANANIIDIKSLLSPMSQINLRCTHFTSNILKFEIISYWNKNIVTIEHINNAAYISSNQNSSMNKLNLIETVCLIKIANSSNPSLLDTLFNKKIKAFEDKMIAGFGLSPKSKFKDYFDLDISSKMELTATLKKEHQGLIPIDETFNSTILDFIANTNLDLKENILKKLNSAKELRKTGFVIAFESKKTYYNSPYPDENINNSIGNFKITPIIGKANKANTQLTSISELFYIDSTVMMDVDISENAKTIINLNNQIKKTNNEASKFDLHKKIFLRLLDEPFVYNTINFGENIRKQNLQPALLNKNPIDIFLQITQDKDFFIAEFKIKSGDDLFTHDETENELCDGTFIIIKNTYYVFQSYLAGQYWLNFPAKIKIEKNHKAIFFSKVIEPISKHFPIEFGTDTFKIESYELDFKTKQVYLKEENQYLVIEPQVEYHNETPVLLCTEGNLLVNTNETIIEYKRNFDLENEFIEFVASLHPNFKEQIENKVFFLNYNEFTKDLWFYKFFDVLQSNNIEVYGLKDLKNFKYSPYKGKINTSITSGEDWFDVNLDIRFGDTSVSLEDIRKAVINKHKYIQLKDGSVGILPSEWLNKLEKYFRNGEIANQTLKISKLRFSIIDELFDNIDENEIFAEILAKRKRLEQFKEIKKTKVPKEIKAELRNYQKEGLNWLNFLHEMQWGGILADDMGLGKTLQVITFLQHIRKQNKSTNLIVIPTTLLFNWDNELKKFAPKLSAHYHYGLNRETDCSSFDDYDIVITTYGILLRDIEMLKDYKFNYIILDESQAIKNPASRRYKAANLLKACNRIALTGTPIENSTFDLFAQMNFVNKGFFGSIQHFKESYSNPIDCDGNTLIAQELQKLINPFVLRRTKEKVTQELPAKTEDIIYCEMESEQRRVYDAYRNSYREKLLNKISEDGINKSKIMVLEALTRLRQICDSPVLLKDDTINEQQSIKIKEIIRHITTKTANHKILLFSQFVEMLSLLKDELNKKNILFEYLDGQCTAKQREQSVTNFQENDDLRVFLISLKAGGIGLNLSAADYVYIIDPWWNPAVENQAIDRCYRIGQDKKVFAYRMICTNTVEEKILKLQDKKMKIATDIIQSDESIMKKLDIKDIHSLFDAE